MQTIKTLVKSISIRIKHISTRTRSTHIHTHTQTHTHTHTHTTHLTTAWYVNLRSSRPTSRLPLVHPCSSGTGPDERALRCPFQLRARDSRGHRSRIEVQGAESLEWRSPRRLHVQRRHAQAALPGNMQRNVCYTNKVLYYYRTLQGTSRSSRDTSLFLHTFQT